MDVTEVYPRSDNEIDATLMLAEYVRGLANASKDKKLHIASDILERYAGRICGQGFLNCVGGKNCGSDHK